MSFDAGQMLVEGYWAMEQVRAEGNRWLVAFFRQHAKRRPGAMFLGIISWHGYRPALRLCRSRRDVSAFL